MTRQRNLFSNEIALSQREWQMAACALILVRYGIEERHLVPKLRKAIDSHEATIEAQTVADRYKIDFDIAAEKLEFVVAPKYLGQAELKLKEIQKRLKEPSKCEK